MKATEGNLLVTSATVCGFRPLAWKASSRVVGDVVPGSWPIA